ncbi:MAG: type IX secretion system membrane protein PorP/SprF [Deferribacteres bacterium]|nr:type IX secretion system membrane protein PorP/SprF [candidate division KSB1 bacterium]MCB9500715.1 type IX secretion system membrane protein PorP/SprF [Deferribacteres bacterium]
MSCLRVKNLVLSTLLCFGAMGTLKAQIAGTDLPAIPTDVHDWRSIQVNPSIAGLQSGALEMGYRVLHAGFADAGTSLFKSGYVVLNFPRRLPGESSLGFASTMFTTPIWQESELHLFFSKRLTPQFELGLSLGAINFNYQTAHFTYLDTDFNDDPVFNNGTSLWKLDTGFGVTYTPTSSILVGLGITHLNRPNVSLIGDDIHLNPALVLGVKFNLQQATVHASAKTSKYTSGSGTVIQLSHSELGTAHLGLDTDRIWARGRLNMRGPFGFAYGMYFPINDFAGQSAGSHEIAVIYEFDRQEQKIELSEPPDDWQTFLPEMPTIRVEPQIIAWAEGDESVDIVSKKIKRDVNSKLDSTALSKLTLFDLGLVDTINVGSEITTFEPHKHSLRDTLHTRSLGYVTRENYFKFLDSLAVDLRLDSNKTAHIITPNSTMERIYLMGEYMQEDLEVPRPKFTINEGSGDVIVDSTFITRNWQGGAVPKFNEYRFAIPDSLVITVFPIDSSMNKHPWTFIVENTNGDTVFTKSGDCKDVRKIIWDWRDMDRKIIPYGFYKYYISWFDALGRLRHSSQRLIYARQLRSEIHIDISKKYNDLDENARLRGLFLNK